MQVSSTRKSATQRAEEYYRKGNGKVLQKEYKGALECFNKAIKISPSFSRAYYKRGNVKRLLNDNEGALADYNKTLAINPKLAEAFNNRGLVKYNLGDIQGGSQDLMRAGRLGYYHVYNVIKTYCR